MELLISLVEIAILFVVGIPVGLMAVAIVGVFVVQPIEVKLGLREPDPEPSAFDKGLMKIGPELNESVSQYLARKAAYIDQFHREKREYAKAKLTAVQSEARYMPEEMRKKLGLV